MNETFMENQKPQNIRTEEQREKDYDRAITLIQNQVQLFWLVFGAFLLSETVLLGAVVSIAKEESNLWILAGSVFGLVLCIPWWTSFKYNHAFYKLRIEEAKECVPSEGRFFLNGNDLIEGKNPLGVSIPRCAILLKPKKAIALMIIMFAIAFLLISVFQVISISKKASNYTTPTTVLRPCWYVGKISEQAYQQPRQVYSINYIN